MMSHCILHIGWHKTGTTTLQQFSYQNRDKLAAIGVHYPDWNHNHGAALVSTFRQDTGYYFAETFVPPRPKFAHIAPAEWGRSVFQDAIRLAKGKTLLLSGEDCV
jgi:hypothetical protein